ncbi:Protocadherin Alpha-1 [Manis pentadactyla]|nr:Protocadherin Alpha-1 [Manis pentadactyla]
MTCWNPAVQLRPPVGPHRAAQRVSHGRLLHWPCCCSVQVPAVAFRPTAVKRESVEQRLSRDIPPPARAPVRSGQVLGVHAPLRSSTQLIQ